MIGNNLGARVLASSLQAKTGEKLLVITTPEMLNSEAQIWINGGHTLGCEVEVIVLKDMTHSGQEPPEEVVAGCGAADVVIMQTQYSLTHTRAGKAAVLNGGRAASLPGADLELLTRTISVDPTPMKNLGETIAEKMRSGQTISISSQNGTHLTAQIRTTAIYNDCAVINPGELGNLPGGEVFFAPLLNSASGKVVIDGSLADDVLDAPITVSIESGGAVHFSGGGAAQRLEKKLRSCGDTALTLAEIGIGTNKQARICDNVLEAEKAYGTVHIAFGNSSAIGGEVSVPIHLDGLISQPVVSIDGKQLLANRTFTL